MQSLKIRPLLVYVHSGCCRYGGESSTKDIHKVWRVSISTNLDKPHKQSCWICNVVQQQLQAGGEVVHGHLLYGGN